MPYFWPSKVIGNLVGSRPCRLTKLNKNAFKHLERARCFTLDKVHHRQTTPAGLRPCDVSPQILTFHPQNPLNDSQINKVHLPFFCVVSSNFAGFWDG